MEVRRVARESYALTLWTYLQRSESKLFESFQREDERIDEAHMITLGYIKGTGPAIARRSELLRKLTAPVTPETKGEKLRRAQEVWARHNEAMKKRLVS